MKPLFRSTQLLTVVTLILLALFATHSSPTATAAPSATYTVNASFDAVDANPGDNICAASANLGSPCTFRAAVEEANLHAGADVINLAPIVYLLTITGLEQSGNVRVGDLDITDPAGLTINGQGAIVISTAPPNNFARTNVLEVSAGATAFVNDLIIENSAQGYVNAGTLTINNGVVRNGRANNGTSSFSTAIFSTGNLTVNGFIVDNMPAANVNAFGGSITARGIGTTISLDNVHVGDIDSVPLVADTGISVGGDNSTVSITNSSVDSTTSAGLLITGGNISIANSTFSHNDLGGIEILALIEGNSPPSVEIVNSTISGNTGRGGIYAFPANGELTTLSLNNVTISNNQGSSNGGSFAGGITIPIASATFSAKNSIIAGNTSLVGGNDCFGTLQSQGHNIIGTTTGCTIAGVTTGNILNQAPALATLADNGGPSQTHALLAGSPALNAGDPGAPGSGGNACAATDQIGSNRPLGAACDIGAVEGALGSATPPILSSLSPNNNTALGPAFTLTVNGSGFNNSAIVRWKGQNRPTTFISANQLQAAIPASDRLLGEVVSVTVFDPVQGVSSNALNFTVNNPVPTVTSSTPTTVGTGFGTLVTINGTNFTSNAQVLMDGVPLPTIFVSSTQVKAKVPKTATSPTGTILTLRVKNPTPGGGTSAGFVTLTSVPLFPPHVGIGTFTSSISASDLLGQLTLNWVHPDDWRNLDTMEVRLLDENGNVVLWVGFVEEFGTQGALVTRDDEGRIASIGFPGDETSLTTDIGTVEMSTSEIHAAPGTTIEVVYAVQFAASVRGRTFDVEISANNNEANNSDGHGFEPAGTITIPSRIYLPFVMK